MQKVTLRKINIIKLFSTLSVVLSLMICSHVFAYDFDKGVPHDVQAQMVQDLDFVTTIQGSEQTPLHQQIFGQLTGATYKNFFDERIASIGIDSCGSPNAVACVYPMIPNKMFITNNYIRFSHPAIARLMVVFHESRHTEYENRNWGHASCPIPFKDADGSDMKSVWTGVRLAGEPACDVTPFGSYGSSTIMIKNISKFCENCNEKVKMDAGIYGDDQYKRIIDTNAKEQMHRDLYGGKLIL
ncbi:MAG: hypothetical protein A2Z20_07330 [Bdellovibrionales bacterium RBG_16_40_8]|nr:MAG: hypothetical protein A2Z20_07330 [Bdellovibrionales bacterium RBG_16_40_8]